MEFSRNTSTDVSRRCVGDEPGLLQIGAQIMDRDPESSGGSGVFRLTGGDLK